MVGRGKGACFRERDEEKDRKRCSWRKSSGHGWSRGKTYMTKEEGARLYAGFKRENF